MSYSINDLPPPWPNQAFAQARKAHQIPLDPNSGVNPVPNVQPVQGSADAGKSVPNGNQSGEVNIKV